MPSRRALNVQCFLGRYFFNFEHAFTSIIVSQVRYPEAWISKLYYSSSKNLEILKIVYIYKTLGVSKDALVPNLSLGFHLVWNACYLILSLTGDLRNGHFVQGVASATIWGLENFKLYFGSYLLQVHCAVLLIKANIQVVPLVIGRVLVQVEFLCPICDYNRKNNALSWRYFYFRDIQISASDTNRQYTRLDTSHIIDYSKHKQEYHLII